MREEAERFCTLIETAESFERDEFVAAVAVSLAELLAAASTLPDLTPTNRCTAPKRARTSSVLAEGAPEGDVVWEWRFGFYSHWGRHATEALRALHARLADRLGPVRDSDS